MEVLKVESVAAGDLRKPLRLLEGSLRDGKPLSGEFVSRMKGSVEAGDIEVLAADRDGAFVGVLVLAFRPNVSLGGDFASVEDLHVEPGERGRGVGRRLVEGAAERCRLRGVSYVEVHVEEDGPKAFYESLGYTEEDVSVLSRSYPLSGDRASGHRVTF